MGGPGGPTCLAPTGLLRAAPPTSRRTAHRAVPPGRHATARGASAARRLPRPSSGSLFPLFPEHSFVHHLCIPPQPPHGLFTLANPACQDSHTVTSPVKGSLISTCKTKLPGQFLPDLILALSSLPSLLYFYVSPSPTKAFDSLQSGECVIHLCILYHKHESWHKTIFSH